jgi:hypothetical protein
MVQELERHVEAYLQGLRREVRHSISGMARTALIAFAIVILGGGAGLTAIIYAINQNPTQPLAIVSYVVLAVAALAIAVAAAGFYLSFAVVRGIERAARYMLEEVARGERELAHVIPGLPALPGAPGDRRPSAPPGQLPRE